MKSILVLTILIQLFSWGIPRKKSLSKCETVARLIFIKELNGAALLKAVRIVDKDTIQILSYSVDFYESNKSVGNKIDLRKAKKLILDSVYHFILYKPTQFRVDNLSYKMMIVVDRDTVWQGFNSATAPFFAKNCRGLMISE